MWFRRTVLQLISILVCTASAEPATGDTRPRTDLLLWAASAGIQCSTLRSDDTLHVRGLAAQTNITGETVIVSLPRRVALSVSAGQKCPAPHLIPEEAWSNAEKHLQLALLLLTEVKKGTNSTWHPYIHSLPSSVNTLLHWTDAQLQELQYSRSGHEQQFLEEVKQRLDEYQELYWKLQSSALVTDLNTTFDELVWASDMVRSRAFAIARRDGWLSPKSIGGIAFIGNVLLRIPFFSQFAATGRVIGICRSVTFMCIGAILFGTQAPGGLDLALLPVIDSINHNSSSQGHLQPSKFGDSIEAFIGPAGVKAGQEVTAAYATATNEVLLQHYGFIDADNSYDYYSANILDFIEQTVIDQPNEEQLQEVHKRPALRNALTEARLTSKGWAPETVQAMRFLFASEEEAQAAKSLSPVRWISQIVQHRQLPTFGFFFDKAQSDATETRVNQVLYSFCQDILASKSTTLKDDTSALTAAQQIREGTERQRLALQFRVAYKGLLHHCVLDHEQGSNASG